ncbi:MAG TPA: TIM barrel protein [Opitutaceae bacterium]|nr:TIM barrel protein [Opitutaceae bacterium]
MENRPVSRRAALRGLAGAAAVTALARASAQSAPAPAPMTPASSIRQSVCKWCFRNIPLATFAPAVKAIGLESVELLAPSDYPVLKQAGLVCALTSNPVAKTPQGVEVGGILKAWNRVEHHDTLVEIYEKRIGEVADAGFDSLICFSGNRDGMDDQQGLENCVKGLQRILPLAEKRGVTIHMELLNSKVNHKDYMCDRTPWGVELVKRAGSERLKLLYDIYHMQIMEGDVIRTIRENHAYIGHYHTAGNPGRNEFAPADVQELNYPAIMRAIKETGFKGFVGQEFVPKRDPMASLQEAFQICAV